MSVDLRNEQQVAEAFSRQSVHFDRIYRPNPIIQYKRQRVRCAVESVLKPGSHILELNAGTGEDALYFASRGHRVHATDLSDGMLQELRRKVTKAGTANRISTELCSFEKLAGLKMRGPYDHIFSNFGGLNCTGDLESVLSSFAPLLQPGGTVTLVLLSKFCLWETLFLLKGEWRTALRRFFSSGGRRAQVEGVAFTCWYYSPHFVRRSLAPEFGFLSQEGLCTIVPPSYRERFPQRWPGLYRSLQRLEDRWRSYWPWRSVGDYFIISFRKKY